VDNLGNASDWDAKIECQPVHTEPERFHELGAEDFAGADWRERFLSHGFTFFACSYRANIRASMDGEARNPH
jgi:hypothetical protein